MVYSFLSITAFNFFNASTEISGQIIPNLYLAIAGAAKGTTNSVMVTLGTGVGGGIILKGKIVAGNRGLGGEVGHFVVNFHPAAPQSVESRYNLVGGEYAPASIRMKVSVDCT